ncbi:MAG: YolD-like family protein [Ruminococcus sp.]|nr:YolD-like family protein [Ruminococcus sp.]
MADNYKDIIHLPHYTSKTRPRMSVYNRAAQFSPFAALTGYDEAVKETARFTDDKAELDEYQIEVINNKLNIALEKKDQNPVLSITFFKPDSRKKGGEYITVSGIIKRIDETSHTVVLTDGSEIPIRLIYDINGEIFEAI